MRDLRESAAAAERLISAVFVVTVFGAILIIVGAVETLETGLGVRVVLAAVVAATGEGVGAVGVVAVRVAITVVVGTIEAFEIGLRLVITAAAAAAAGEGVSAVGVVTVRVAVTVVVGPVETFETGLRFIIIAAAIAAGEGVDAVGVVAVRVAVIVVVVAISALATRLGVGIVTTATAEREVGAIRVVAVRIAIPIVVGAVEALQVRLGFGLAFSTAGEVAAVAVITVDGAVAVVVLTVEACAAGLRVLLGVIFANAAVSAPVVIAIDVTVTVVVLAVSAETPTLLVYRCIWLTFRRVLAVLVVTIDVSIEVVVLAIATVLTLDNNIFCRAYIGASILDNNVELNRAAVRVHDIGEIRVGSAAVQRRCTSIRAFRSASATGGGSEEKSGGEVEAAIHGFRWSGEDGAIHELRSPLQPVLSIRRRDSVARGTHLTTARVPSARVHHPAQEEHMAEPEGGLELELGDRDVAELVLERVRDGGDGGDGGERLASRTSSKASNYPSAGARRPSRVLLGGRSSEEPGIRLHRRIRRPPSGSRTPRRPDLSAR
ncbi:MAG: hypothetical protein ACJAYU_000935 [Bradymonadia bacterium]|jgi:hypothetical protein